MPQSSLWKIVLRISINSDAGSRLEKLSVLESVI